MKVLKSWGSSGEVVLSLDGQDSPDLKSQEPVFIDFDELPVPFFIESMQAKGTRLIVKFEDVDTLAAAEELVGREARIAGQEEKDEETVVGMRIRDARSRKVIGTVVDFSDYGGNTLITVKTVGGEVMLPLHEDLIVSIRGDVLTLDIPEGLL